MTLAITLMLPDKSADRLTALAAEMGVEPMQVIATSLQLLEVAVFKTNGEVVAMLDGIATPVLTQT